MLRQRKRSLVLISDRQHVVAEILSVYEVENQFRPGKTIWRLILRGLGKTMYGCCPVNQSLKPGDWVEFTASVFTRSDGSLMYKNPRRFRKLHYSADSASLSDSAVAL